MAKLSRTISHEILRTDAIEQVLLQHCKEDFMPNIPFALFNSKALFNPYQYKPFFACMTPKENGWTWNEKNLFITDEVGVGKTFETGILLLELLKENPSATVLIICPAKLCHNWHKEMHENFYLNFTNYRETKHFGQLTILSYSYFQLQPDSLTLAQENQLETAFAEDTAEALPYWEMPQLPEYDILVLDEAHYIRNRGKLYRCIEKMICQNESTQAKPKIFLTATPIFNAESDYENITGLLKWNGQSFHTTTTLQGEANCYDFQLNIAIEEVFLNDAERAILNDLEKVVPNDYGNDCSKYGNLTGFLKRVAASSFHTLQEFLEKKSEFMQGEETLFLQDDREIDLSDLTHLCEEWSNHECDNGQLPDSKLAVLNQLLGTINDKAVIFSCFLNTCAYLKEQLAKLTGVPVFEVTGKTTSSNMQTIINNFEHTKGKAILICSDAIKEGQNFQFCHHLIHYDFPFTPAAIGQRNGRIYRRGQKEIPHVYYLFASGTYDERLFGEIILSKTKIIKAASEKDLISTLSILPNDAKKYFDQCIAAYFQELVQKYKNKETSPETSPEPPEQTNKSPEQRVLRSVLRKQFSHMEPDQQGNNRLVWDWETAEEVYRLDVPAKQCCGRLQEILSVCLPENQGQVLQTTYQERYQATLQKFNELVFQCSSADAFHQCCEQAVGEVGTQNFCHNMYPCACMPLAEYQAKFIPLIEIKGAQTL